MTQDRFRGISALRGSGPVEVRTADDSVLYRESSIDHGDGAAADAAQVVTVDVPIPHGEHEAFAVLARELVRGLRATQPPPPPPRGGSTWPWLIPAMLVFAVGVANVVSELTREADVDCVAYVQTLTELTAAFPSPAVLDAAALEESFGSAAIDRCGTPDRFLTAVGR